jgi:phage shock protein PspC (stress-responsive transcriptional regulator)
MEEDAYLHLQQVLSHQWKKDELEAQVAAKLEEKLVGGKTVAVYPDVVDALYQLGLSQFEQSSAQASSRKLYRQPANKMIAGVCTGLGEYLEVDPVVLRIAFILMFVLGFWAYLILWIVVPKLPQTLNV